MGRLLSTLTAQIIHRDDHTLAEPTRPRQTRDQLAGAPPLCDGTGLRVNQNCFLPRTLSGMQGNARGPSRRERGRLPPVQDPVHREQTSHHEGSGSPPLTRTGRRRGPGVRKAGRAGDQAAAFQGSEEVPTPEHQHDEGSDHWVGGRAGKLGCPQPCHLMARASRTPSPLGGAGARRSSERTNGVG